MNVVSVQIYFDANTPWNRSKIEFPIDPSTTKWPGNGCGLCNQFFKLINTLCYVDNQQHDIYIDLFSKDYQSGETIPASKILDLAAMREKHGYKIYDIMELDHRSQYKTIADPYVFRAYQQNKDLFSKNAKCFEFNGELVEIAKKAISNKGLIDKTVNMVHLRIDQDMQRHILSTYGEERYTWLIDSYRSQIHSRCDKSIPLVLLLEDIEHPFVKELMEDYEVVVFEKKDIAAIEGTIEGREMFALIDLIIGLNLKVSTFIGYEGSSFSIIIDQMCNYQDSYIFN